MSPVPSPLKPPTPREQSALLREKYTRRLHPDMSFEGLRTLGMLVMPWAYYDHPWGGPSSTTRITCEVLQYAGHAVEYASRWPDRDLGGWFEPAVLRSAARSGVHMRDLLRRYEVDGPSAFLTDQAAAEISDDAATRLPDAGEVEALVTVASHYGCQTLLGLDNLSALAACVLYDRWPDLGTRMVAAQSTLPEGLLMTMTNSDDTFLRVEIARHVGLSDLLMAVLLRDPSHFVREALVGNADARARLSREDVHGLASRQDSPTGRALCQHMPVLEESVLWLLVAGMGRTRHVETLLRRPDLTEPMLLDLVSTRLVVREHLDLVAGHPQGGDEVARVLAASLPGARAAVKAGLTIESVRVDVWLAQSGSAVDRARAAAASTDGSLLRELASDSSVSVRRRVASRMVAALGR